MLTFVSRVALEVLPPPALNFFNNICHNLHSFIVKTFQGMPLHVLEARLEPATRFAELISRMMKVNNSAHAASQVLENDDGREQLHQEWVTLVNPKRLMEGELPGCGYEITYKILTEEMATLLRPLTAPPVYQDGLPYDAPGDTVDNYVERIDVLLRSLPIRFPQASARTIVSCVKNLSTAAMREFTMQGANSFHAWWIVKVFVDEYSQWLITSGGFMAHRAVKPGRPSPSLTGAANGLVQSSAEASRIVSRGSSAASAVSDEMDESGKSPLLSKHNVTVVLRTQAD
jgi:regulatory factor X